MFSFNDQRSKCYNVLVESLWFSRQLGGLNNARCELFVSGHARGDARDVEYHQPQVPDKERTAHNLWFGK